MTTSLQGMTIQSLDSIAAMAIFICNCHASDIENRDAEHRVAGSLESVRTFKQYLSQSHKLSRIDNRLAKFYYRFALNEQHFKECVTFLKSQGLEQLTADEARRLSVLIVLQNESNLAHEMEEKGVEFFELKPLLKLFCLLGSALLLISFGG